jgi:hypothetical protein
MVAQPTAVKPPVAQPTTVNWPLFLSRNDMVFDTLTTQWEEGAFIGNGLLGAMIYMTDSNALRIEIGRTDVVEPCPERSHIPSASNRLPIGHFVLRPAGKILSNTARIDLWNAEIRGLLNTDKGSIQWRALTLSQSNVILLETQTTGSERLFSWLWIPGEPVNTPAYFAGQPALQSCPANPAGKLHTVTGDNKLTYYHQPLATGGSFTTAWQSTAKLNKRIYYISVGYSPLNGKSVPEVLNTIKTVSLQNMTALLSIHRDWWHQYYRQSFLSLPDALLESFYWIQQYKLGSLLKNGKPLADPDLTGPWFYPHPLPAYRWNLNTPLKYSPLYAANHLGISQLLTTPVNKNISASINPESAQYRYNALALYYYWLQYRYEMDKKILAGLFPVLKRNTNYYLNILQKEEDGKYHLPDMILPECPDSTTRDDNYDLSLLRWSCQTLLTANDSLKTNDTLVTKWQEVLQNLTGYPTDTNSLRIGRDKASCLSCRCFSHLSMIYPLHIMNQPEDSDLIKKSVQYWFGNPGAPQNYSYPGAASFYALMGRGNEARDYLHTLITKLVTPNTMCLQNNQVTETPLPAATSIQEMCLQSWGNIIRVFPAIPDDWTNAAFKDLRAEGAFLISSVRKNKETKWVSIKAETDGTCIIQPGIPGVVIIRSTNATMPVNKGEGIYEITMRKGEEVLMYGDETSLQEEPDVVTWDEKIINPLGKKK